MSSCDQRITAIEKQGKKPNRRSIFINGKFALGVDASVVLDLGLQVGQQMTEEKLQAIVRAELAAKAWHKALRLLEYRPRSKKEIVRRLETAGFAEDIIEETLTRLEQAGLVDDLEFSKSWVSHRLTENAIGKTRIRWELRQKGVPTEVIEEAVSAIGTDTEYQLAMDTAKRRWERDKDLDLNSKRRRLASYLRRRGFDWDVITKVMNELVGTIR